MFCPSCGFQNSPNAAFCGKCGTSLVQARVPDPPAVQPAYSVAAPPAPAQIPPPQSRNYSYSQSRSYGRRSGSVLGWILLILAAAGLAGCFLVVEKGESHTVVSMLKDTKSVLMFPIGFGLMLIGALFLGLGSGPRALWIALAGIGAGAAGAGAAILMEGAGYTFTSFGIGSYLLMGAAAVGLLVVLVESMFSPD